MLPECQSDYCRESKCSWTMVHQKFCEKGTASNIEFINEIAHLWIKLGRDANGGVS